MEQFEIAEVLIKHGAHFNRFLGLFGTKNEQILKAIHKKQFENYSEQIKQRDDNDYHRSFDLFGVFWNFRFWGACSAKEKKEAWKALNEVVSGKIEQ